MVCLKFFVIGFFVVSCGFVVLYVFCWLSFFFGFKDWVGYDRLIEDVKLGVRGGVMYCGEWGFWFYV